MQQQQQQQQDGAAPGSAAYVPDKVKRPELAPVMRHIAGVCLGLKTRIHKEDGKVRLTGTALIYETGTTIAAWGSSVDDGYGTGVKAMCSRMYVKFTDPADYEKIRAAIEAAGDGGFVGFPRWVEFDAISERSHTSEKDAKNSEGINLRLGGVV